MAFFMTKGFFMTNETDKWTDDDYSSGYCQKWQVGLPYSAAAENSDTPKPDPAVPELPAAPVIPLPDMSKMTDAEIAQTSVRLLREATVEVFHRIGASNWLYELARNNPKEFLKMLQRLLPQSIEASVTVQPFEVPKHIRDLSLEDLKAMRAGSAPAIDGLPLEKVVDKASGSS